jgi:hypothetical protein
MKVKWFTLNVGSSGLLFRFTSLSEFDYEHIYVNYTQNNAAVYGTCLLHAILNMSMGPVCVYLSNCTTDTWFQNPWSVKVRKRYTKPRNWRTYILKFDNEQLTKSVGNHPISMNPVKSYMCTIVIFNLCPQITVKILRWQFSSTSNSSCFSNRPTSRSNRFLRIASCCVYTMNVYNYYSQRNVNLFIYIGQHVSTSNTSSSSAATFLHTVTKLGMLAL